MSRVRQLPWAGVVGMRHILVHAYLDVDVDSVARVIINHLPSLNESLDTALNNWGKDGDGIEETA
ncbi:MAG TPA: HepT-like ribonuclease domain-containing protein [Tepidisphaeraceae bacterium]|nr:HepT-like ribonuclease domain-containing protein [Tepidisphaeraceae bacterium]